MQFDFIQLDIKRRAQEVERIAREQRKADLLDVLSPVMAAAAGIALALLAIWLTP